MQDVARQLLDSTLLDSTVRITNTVAPVDLVDPAKLMGAYEIRVRLGDLSETRGRQITMRPDFPPPIKVLAMGQVWDGAAVEAWIAEHRPVKDDEDTEA